MDHNDHHNHDQPAAQKTVPAPATTPVSEHDHSQHVTASAPDHSGHGAMHEGHLPLMRQRFWLSLALTVPVLLYSQAIQTWFGFTMPVFPGSNWVAPILGSLIFFLGGTVFLGMARHEIQMRQPGMMTLISIAVVTAYLYSVGLFFFPPIPDSMTGAMPMMDFWWELATLITIMLLGHWLELRSVGQAQGALKELARLLPDTAERLTADGSPQTVQVSELKIEDVLLIRPGASIPADAVVIEGESSVNEAMLTGESSPVTKRVGERVIAGAVNGSGALRVKVDRVGDGTALAGIMKLVADAQASQSRAQTLAQRAAFYLTFIALGAGVLTLIGWLIFTGNVSDAVRYTVGVLVVACPHALGLAVPLVVSISTTLAARNGLLVRKRVALESAKDLNVVIFDKTGTLTEGKQGVVSVVTNGLNEDEAVRLAAGLEGDSEHPIAQAVRDFAQQRSITPAKVDHFDSLAGRGVRGDIDGVTHWIGGPRLLEYLKATLPQPLITAREAAEKAGHAVVYLTREAEVLGFFIIADSIRPESAQAVRDLQAMNIEVVMMTGDNEAVAKNVAESLGIKTYFAQVLPEHKADRVRELKANGKKIAMVGDGINDAPALAMADVGIAIGAGTDVAIESAGIVLVRSNPQDIVKIARLSSATYSKMIQNLWWAAGYNVVAIPLAMGVLAPWGITLDPAVGAALMSLSTIIVAANAQLLRRTVL